MPILRISEIRSMSSEDRARRLIELKIELIKLNAVIKAGGTVENHSRVREIKRTIARILTVQREEELKLRKAVSK